MKHFVEYWIGVLKLTKEQALAAFYRFVRFSAEKKQFKWYDLPPASHCSVGVENCKDPACPVKKELARMDAARKEDEDV